MLDVHGLRYWRRRRALSQEDLAKLTDMDQATIARIEARQTARPSTVRRLAAALEISIDQLVQGEPAEQGQQEAA